MSKFPTAKRKIASRPFAKTQRKLRSQPLATGTSKIASRPFPQTQRKLTSRPFAIGTAKIASRKPPKPKKLGRPATEQEGQDRLAALAKEISSLKTASNLPVRSN